MSAGLIKDGKLYVALQRLQNFAATQSGYIAVIDTATNTEIDTGKGSNGLKGIELPVNDPVRLALVPNSDDLLVVADGGFDNFVQQRSEENTSELQSVMRISYAVFCLKKKKEKV